MYARAVQIADYNSAIKNTMEHYSLLLHKSFQVYFAVIVYVC